MTFMVTRCTDHQRWWKTTTDTWFLSEDVFVLKGDFDTAKTASVLISLAHLLSTASCMYLITGKFSRDEVTHLLGSYIATYKQAPKSHWTKQKFIQCYARSTFISTSDFLPVTLSLLILTRRTVTQPNVSSPTQHDNTTRHNATQPLNPCPRLSVVSHCTNRERLWISDGLLAGCDFSLCYWFIDFLFDNLLPALRCLFRKNSYFQVHASYTFIQNKINFTFHVYSLLMI